MIVCLETLFYVLSPLTAARCTIAILLSTYLRHTREAETTWKRDFDYVTDSRSANDNRVETKRPYFENVDPTHVLRTHVMNRWSLLFSFLQCRVSWASLRAPWTTPYSLQPLPQPFHPHTSGVWWPQKMLARTIEHETLRRSKTPSPKPRPPRQPLGVTCDEVMQCHLNSDEIKKLI